MITGMTKYVMSHISWISILKFCILISFRTPSVLHSYPMVLLRLSVSKFFLVFYNHCVWPIFQNLPISLYPLIPQYCYIFMLTYRLRCVWAPDFCRFNAYFIMSYYVFIPWRNRTSWCQINIKIIINYSIACCVSVH
jgi:hypothetical protein